MSAEQECSGCGSSVSDRENYRKRNGDQSIPVGTKNCPHCGNEKCCMCDMGDDTSCLGCEGPEHTSEGTEGECDGDG
jgi:hypothetical protein